MPYLRRTRPSTIHEAIALLREEIEDRQTALAVLNDLLARYPAEVEPRPRVGAPMPPVAPVGDPPTPGFTYSERGHTLAHDAPAGDDANVVPLPKRDAG